MKISLPYQSILPWEKGINTAQLRLYNLRNRMEKKRMGPQRLVKKLSSIPISA
jgi:hypothetical protein